MVELAQNFGDLGFVGLTRTEERLNQPSFAPLLAHFFNSDVLASYQSQVDLLFCEIFPEWRDRCQLFYAARGGRLFSYNESSPKQLLEWDLFLADTVLPRLKDLFLKGRRRWASVLRELRMPPPPPKRLAQRESIRALPTSLGIHKACFEALEHARLRGVLCRLVHELVEAARFADVEWFRRSLGELKRFSESLPPQSLGDRLPSKVFLERLHYVEQLPQYAHIRSKLFSFLREYPFSFSDLS